MQSENTKNLSDIGDMKKRRVLMADGRRYLIYYTFGNESNSLNSDEKQTTESGVPRDENEPVLNSPFIIPNSSIVPEERENV